jgi:predicted enzyme related to lactoylglutathione lyase
MSFVMVMTYETHPMRKGDFSSSWITVIYPVKDAGRAKGLFGKLLGSEPYVDQPYYVGFRVGEQEIGLLPNGHATGMSGPLAYFHVDDIKKALEVLVKEGAQQPVKDVGAGKLVASIKDADSNPIGLLPSTWPLRPEIEVRHLRCACPSSESATGLAVRRFGFVLAIVTGTSILPALWIHGIGMRYRFRWTVPR